MAGTSFLRTGANSPEVARRDRVQDRAKLRGALATEHRLEPRLRLCPVLGGRTQPRGAGIGHVQLLAAAVGAPFRYGDEFLALERQLIVVGPIAFSFARIENWVVRSPAGARTWS